MKKVILGILSLTLVSGVSVLGIGETKVRATQEFSTTVPANAPDFNAKYESIEVDYPLTILDQNDKVIWKGTAKEFEKKKREVQALVKEKTGSDL